MARAERQRHAHRRRVGVATATTQEELGYGVRKAAIGAVFPALERRDQVEQLESTAAAPGHLAHDAASGHRHGAVAVLLQLVEVCRGHDHRSARRRDLSQKPPHLGALIGVEFAGRLDEQQHSVLRRREQFEQAADAHPLVITSPHAHGAQAPGLPATTDAAHRRD